MDRDTPSTDIEHPTSHLKKYSEVLGVGGTTKKQFQIIEIILIHGNNIYNKYCML